MGQQIAVGLDVGTTKTCAVVADVSSGSAEMLGIGLSSCAGLKKGIVINIDATVDSIRKALRAAETSAGVRIKSVSVGISGSHINGFESRGAVGIKGREVTSADVVRSIDSAKTVYIPLDREVLHVLPTEFVLDGQDGITDPVGMSGVRLEARVHIVTGAASPMQNLLKCCEKAGLEVAEVVFEPLASAHATLTREEKETGVIVIDIGGGTTDIALFREGSLRYASVIGVGGNHFTNDVAVGLRINMTEAEKLKKGAGAAYEGIIQASEEIELPQAGGQKRVIPRKYVAEILQPRCEETLELIKSEIQKSSGYGTAICGVVLTGGASLLSGFDKMAETVLGLPVRQGLPLYMKGLKSGQESPIYATAAGLVTYSYLSDMKGPLPADLMSGAFGRMTEWVRDKFRYADYLFNMNNKKEGGTLCLKSRK